jgi:Flp pilus assembly protein TadG
MTMITLLRCCQRGAAAIEFAIAVPVMVVSIYGIFQVGMLYEANAGMQHALGEGARLASLYDRTTTTHVPTDASIKAKMSAKLFGRNGGTFVVADPVSGTGFKTLSITYTRHMDFLFLPGPNVSLNRSKKVYTTTST